MRIQYSRQAAKAIERLDRAAKQRIKSGIEGIPKGDILPLRGASGNYRLRIGGWRVIFSYLDDETPYIIKVAPRGDVYKES